MWITSKQRLQLIWLISWNNVRVKDLKDDKKEFTELEKVRTEYLRFFIINDFWEVREIDRPNGQTLINMIDELDV